MAETLSTFIASWSVPWYHAAGSALLMAAAFFGCGKLLLFSFPKKHFTAFACGAALFMALFALLPAKTLLLWGFMLPFSLYGVYRLFALLRQYPLQGLFAGAFFLFTLASALLPPYAWDEQTYQLAVPLRALQENSFAPFADNPYSFYPALSAWFWANAIKLGGLELPRILVGMITPLLVLELWQMGKRHGKITAATGAAALLFSPLVLNMNRAVYAENFIALFTFGGIAAFFAFRKRGFYAPLLCGVLAGSAFAMKPTGALGSMMIFLLFLFNGKEWKKLLIFCGTAFLFSFFWYLRTFLHTGNFFYPYAFAPLPESVEHFHQLMGSARYGLDGAAGALLNWLFAGFDKKLFDGMVTGFLFPALGAAAVAGAWIWKKRHPRHTGAVLCALAILLLPVLCWSIFFPQSRFLLPCLPAAALLGVVALNHLPMKKWLFACAGVLLLLTVAFQTWPFLKHYTVSWKILGAVRKDFPRALGFLARDPGLFKSFEYLASSTPKEARCLLLMERRGLYCPRKYALAAPGFEPTLTPVPETSEKLFELLKAFDYIIVGETTQDVDLQSVSADECKKVFSHLKELLDEGKLRAMPSSGYPVLKVVQN